MRHAFDKIRKKVGSDNYDKNKEFIETFYIKKYGGVDKARAVLEELGSGCANDEEYQLALEAKLKKDFHLETLKKILKPFLGVKSVTALARNLYYFKKNVQSIPNQKEIIDALSMIETVGKSAFEETYEVNESTKKSIIDELNLYANINLVNLREELGFPHPRTFNYWLKFFFDGKYDKKLNEGNSKNSGKLSIYEYVEIVSAFILSYDEDKLDFSRPKELLKRFELQRITQKQVLKELTSNNYSRLREKIENFHDSDIYKAKFGKKPYDTTKRKIPYSLVSIIKEDIVNGYVK